MNKNEDEFLQSIEVLGETPKTPEIVNQIIKFIANNPPTIATTSLSGKLDTPEELYPALKFITSIDTLRFLIRYAFDPVAVSAIGRIDPLPHQLEAFLEMINHNEIRMLIADDVGLGKTIEVGLVLKELILRKQLKTILIIVPPTLAPQWVLELKDKFSEDFTLLHGSFRKQNVINNDKIVVSLDTLKQPEKTEWFEEKFWDMIVVDEAHKLNPKTMRYNSVKRLHSKHLLLLSATPHDGKNENFRDRLALLNSNLRSLDENTLIEILPKYMIRRLKRDAIDFEGKPIFHTRFTPQTVKLEMSEEERTFYDLAEEYIRDYYLNPETREKYRNIIFILLVFLRRISSSLYSGLKSLYKRRNKVLATLNEEETIIDDEKLLNELVHKQKSTSSSKISIQADHSDFSFKSEILVEDIVEAISEESSVVQRSFLEILEELDDTYDEEKERIEEEIIEINIPIHKDALRVDLDFINKVIKAGERLLKKGIDSKVEKLVETVNLIRKERPKDKIIIFTEFKDTMNYLERVLQQEGFLVSCIWGTSLEEKQLRQKEFEKTTEILIGTRAASEGLNLQFANIVINFELPWNPNRLEQRIGRVYRYGQLKPVVIYNFTSTLPVENRIISKLYEKIEKIRQNLGDAVVDVLGNIISHEKISDFILEAFTEPIKAESQLEMLIDDRMNLVTEIEKKYFVSPQLDFEQYTKLGSIFRLVSSFDLERYVLAMLWLLGVGVELQEKESVKFYQINTPILIKKLNPKIRKKLSTLPHEYCFTFEKSIPLPANINYVALGHILLETLMEHQMENLESAVLIKADIEEPGVLVPFIHYLEHKNNKNIIYADIKLASIFKDEIEIMDSIFLWDLEPYSISPNKEHIKILKKQISKIPKIQIPLDFIENEDEVPTYLLSKNKQVRQNILEQMIIVKHDEYRKTLKVAMQGGMDYLEEGVREERRELDKLSRSVSSLIENNYDVTNYELKIETLPIFGLIIPTNMKKLEESEFNPFESVITKEDLEAYGDLLRPDIGEIIKKKYEVDRAGMRAVIEYEQNRGFNPTDVSQETYRGYDVYSVNPTNEREERYIEVKSFQKTGRIQITPNEWRVAEIYPNKFYLYIVINALDQEKRQIFDVGNPKKNFMDVVQKKEIIEYKYVIDWKEIQKLGLDILE